MEPMVSFERPESNVTGKWIDDWGETNQAHYPEWHRNNERDENRAEVDDVLDRMHAQARHWVGVVATMVHSMNMTVEERDSMEESVLNVEMKICPVRKHLQPE